MPITLTSVTAFHGDSGPFTSFAPLNRVVWLQNSITNRGRTAYLSQSISFPILTKLQKLYVIVSKGGTKLSFKA